MRTLLSKDLLPTIMLAILLMPSRPLQLNIVQTMSLLQLNLLLTMSLFQQMSLLTASLMHPRLPPSRLLSYVIGASKTLVHMETKAISGAKYGALADTDHLQDSLTTSPLRQVDDGLQC